MIKKTSKGILLIFTLLILSCKSLTNKNDKAMLSLENTEWQLEKIKEQLYITNKYQPEGISISFSDFYFSTNDGCNAIGGEYKIENNLISFDQIKNTLKMCDEDRMAYFYSVPFHEVKKFKVVKNKLYLYDANELNIIAQYSKK